MRSGRDIRQTFTTWSKGTTAKYGDPHPLWRCVTITGSGGRFLAGQTAVPARLGQKLRAFIFSQPPHDETCVGKRYPGPLLAPPCHRQCLAVTVGPQLPTLQRSSVQDCSHANSFRRFTDRIHHPTLGDPIPPYDSFFCTRSLFTVSGEAFSNTHRGAWDMSLRRTAPPSSNSKGNHDVGITVAPLAVQLGVQATFRHHFERPIPLVQDCNQGFNQVHNDELVPPQARVRSKMGLTAPCQSGRVMKIN